MKLCRLVFLCCVTNSAKQCMPCPPDQLWETFSAQPRGFWIILQGKSCVISSKVCNPHEYASWSIWIPLKHKPLKHLSTVCLPDNKQGHILYILWVKEVCALLTCLNIRRFAPIHRHVLYLYYHLPYVMFSLYEMRVILACSLQKAAQVEGNSRPNKWD